jgi:hypothetical protein
MTGCGTSRKCRLRRVSAADGAKADIGKLWHDAFMSSLVWRLTAPRQARQSRRTLHGRMPRGLGFQVLPCFGALPIAQRTRLRNHFGCSSSHCTANCWPWIAHCASPAPADSVGSGKIVWHCCGALTRQKMMESVIGI